MAKGPLVHCITNAVTAPFVADCIAAVGGRPIMAEDPHDCADLTKVADGLCINLGQLNEQKREAILASLKNRGGRPWVLDPVGVGALPNRLTFAQQLLDYKPSIIRGNASEIYALATGKASGSGVDSTSLSLSSKEWASLVSSLLSPQVIVTNIYLTPYRRDAAYAAGKETFYSGGRFQMGSLPGFGCAMSAVAATLNDGKRSVELFSLSAKKMRSVSLGDFRANFISTLAREQRPQNVRDMLRLYFIAGPQDCPDLDTVLQAALLNGVTCYQRREKTAGQGDPKGLRIAQLSSVPLIWNDNWIEAVKADGLHLGQTDGDPKQAREKLGPEAIIGLSVSEPSHWRKYDPRYVDYVGLGPFATTQTKPDTRKPLGVDGIRKLREGYEHVPAVAIGGIDENNALEALGSGVDGIAVVSAIAKARDPALATRNLAALVRSHFAPKPWTYN